MQTVVDLLKELFTYNQHTNRKLIQFFQQHQFSDDRVFSLFSHILNAHHIWLSRIEQQPPLYSVWQIQEASDFEDLDTSNHQQTDAILTGTTDLNRVLAYHTSSGASFKNTIHEILIHVVNHSTYHRGQIATRIRERGYDPPATDYIFYKREK